MKNLFPFIIIAFSSFVFYSCNKASTIPSNAPTASEWLFNGVTYKGVYTSLNLSILNATDPTGNEIYINFSKVPTTRSVYAVNNGAPDTSGCYIEISGYRSTGAPGNQVNVTVTGGKITASFANITVDNSGNAVTTVSGTLIQQ